MSMNNGVLDNLGTCSKLRLCICSKEDVSACNLFCENLLVVVMLIEDTKGVWAMSLRNKRIMI